MLGCCGIAALATHAHAQSPSAQRSAQGEPTRIEEVVVTAQRSEQGLQSVPVAVTAFDRATIEKQSIATIEDVQFHAPNVQIRQDSAFGGLTVGIRGINVTSDNFSFDPAVGVYVNGLYMARSNDFSSVFYDVSNLQVLRGPQGTLFGRDTPVGALLIDTTRPGSTYGGYVKAGVGGGGHLGGSGANRTFYRVEGAVDLPVSPVLAIRLAGYYVNDNGWARSLATGYKSNSKDNSAQRATTVYTPTDQFKATLILDHSKTREGAPTYSPLLFPSQPIGADLLNGGTAVRDELRALVTANNPYFNRSWFPNSRKNRSESTSAVLQLNYQINDEWTVDSTTGWRRTSRFTTNNNFGSSSTLSGPSETHLHQSQFSQEFVLHGDISTQMHFIGGMFYFNERGDNRVDLFNTLIPAGARLIPVDLRLNGNNIDNTSQSVFGNLSYDITPELTASVGMRYNDEKKIVSIDNAFVAITGTALDPKPGAVIAPFGQGTGVGAFKDNPSVYDAKLTWKISPDLLAYAKYGTGYRAGGVGYQAGVIVPFDAETSRTYELGAKWDFQIGDAPARLNVAVFDTTYRNFQVPVVTSTVISTPAGQTTITSSAFANAGAAKIKGAELEFTIRPISGLTITSSLGLLDPKYKTFIIQGVEFKNNKLRNASKVEFTLSAGYTMPTSVGDLVLQGDYAYSSSYETEIRNQTNAPVGFKTPLLRQGPTNTFNGRVTLAKAFGSNVDVSLWGKNLSDEKRIVYSLVASGLTNAVYAEPMSYGIELQAAF